MIINIKIIVQFIIKKKNRIINEYKLVSFKIFLYKNKINIILIKNY